MSKNKNLAQVFHFDLYGKRQEKYDFLKSSSLKDIEWNILDNRDPNYFYVKKDLSLESDYIIGFKLDNIFIRNASGIKTQRDDASITISKDECDNLLNDFIKLEVEELRSKYGFKDVRDWKISYAKKDLMTNNVIANKLMYRPFDIRNMLYTGKTKGVMGYPRKEVMSHMAKGNYSLISCRFQAFNTICFITSLISNIRTYSNPGSIGTDYAFPLYLYTEKSEQQSIDSFEKRKPNLKPEMVSQLAKVLGLEFVPDHELIETIDHDKYFTPLDLLDYIYAVLHSPNYREKYKEFLKIDFPRVPYPKDRSKFWKLVALGGEIRGLHLLESKKVEDYITSYPHDGNNQITTKISKKDWELFDEVNGLGRIWINEKQCFDNIPLVAWEFYIGGYQPAQKWLKDRRERTLTHEDVQHYSKIIVALTETDRLMKEINKVGVE